SGAGHEGVVEGANHVEDESARLADVDVQGLEQFMPAVASNEEGDGEDEDGAKKKKQIGAADEADNAGLDARADEGGLIVSVGELVAIDFTAMFYEDGKDLIAFAIDAENIGGATIF